MKLGFLGLGLMGGPMARNLLKGGHELTVWNRTGAACAALVGEGARQADTPAAVVTASDLTFAMLSDPAASLAVACGPDGVCAGLERAAEPGRGYIDCSTVDAATSTRIAAEVTRCGGRFLEAPVSGSRGPAAQGTLVILAAGDEDLYAAAEPALALLGNTRLHLGAVGNGARLKLVVNMVMGGMMTSFCEGLHLTRQAGLQQADLLAVLAAGALANPMFAGKGPQMLAASYDAAFPLKHMAKDLRLALELGRETGTPLAASAAAGEAFARALAAGDGDLDFSALLRTVQD